MPMTPSSYHALGLTIRLHCRACAHEANLDLAALIERGLGDRDLRELRHVCRICGSRDIGSIVSPETRRGEAVQKGDGTK